MRNSSEITARRRSAYTETGQSGSKEFTVVFSKKCEERSRHAFRRQVVQQGDADDSIEHVAT